MTGSDSEGSSEPKKYKTLREIYDATEEIKLEDEELFLMGVEEPMNYKQVARSMNWKQAMKQEIEVVKKNNTWKLTELPPGHKAIS